MRIACYSDLHLEFQHTWNLPQDLEADVLVLAGDIIVFDDFSPLKKFLRNWNKPVLMVSGNHEYYTRQAMFEHHTAFKKWLDLELPQVRFLYNEGATISDFHFFGGTMWTDFQHGNEVAKRTAASGMNDFQLIRTDNAALTPDDAIVLHQDFISALTLWLENNTSDPRIVITHHAPVVNANTRYMNSPLQPVFVAHDILPIIEKYQPDFWIYGHTHECDRQWIGKTRIISNQLGYPLKQGQYECSGQFDEYGFGECFNMERANR